MAKTEEGCPYCGRMKKFNSHQPACDRCVLEAVRSEPSMFLVIFDSWLSKRADLEKEKTKRIAKRKKDMEERFRLIRVDAERRARANEVEMLAMSWASAWERVAHVFWISAEILKANKGWHSKPVLKAIPSEIVSILRKTPPLDGRVSPRTVLYFSCLAIRAVYGDTTIQDMPRTNKVLDAGTTLVSIMRATEHSIPLIFSAMPTVLPPVPPFLPREEMVEAELSRSFGPLSNEESSEG